jgi:phosphoribosyl-AMP cyclohydrolase
MTETNTLTVNPEYLEKVKFDDRGLVPAVAQNIDNGEILMLGYMNKESLDMTFKSSNATFWSRSRQKLWMKGETSGNVIKIQKILIDCDGDTLILQGNPAGPACHTGERTCFYRTLAEKPD